MDWRVVWRSSVGDVADDEYLSPLTASLAFFTINVFTGILLRGLNKALTPPFLQEYVADFLSTMEMCAYFFENNFVKANYGNAGLFIAVVLQGFIVNRTFGDSIDNPVKVLGQYMTGSCSVLKAIVKIAILALAGVASYRFARMVWALDLISDHHARYYETECVTDLNVTLLWGIMVELSATLADAWLGKQTVSKFSILDEFIKCSNGALMIIAGLHLTGMYFNPAMATGHLYGCKGADVGDFFLVYWSGPFIGAYLAIIIDRFVHIDRSVKPAADIGEQKKDK